MTTVGAGQADSGLEVRLLGPVEVVRNGATVAIGGPRQRALLGLLATQAGRIAAIDWLIDELWSGEPPDGADVTLRSYVSRLRSVIGEDAPIRGTGAGYTLGVPPGVVDSQRFESLIRQAQERVLRRSHVRAREQLREALALWRGRPFGELSTDGALRVEAERLEDLRLHALELRIDADLEIGAAGGLADELEELVREHPYREAFWRQLMLALYRSQRQADALAAYHRARAALADDLGIEPGAELRALEAAILRQDVPGPTPPEARYNLPAPLSSFVGRASELGELEGLLGSNRLVTLTGIGGVGKTRLAIEAAWRMAADHADGAAFIDLAPLSDPELLAANVAASMEIREQPGVRPIDGLVTQLRERAVLVVLDNCEHLRDACADLAAAVLRSCPSVRILATSREPLGVPGEVDFPVAPLGLAAGESEAAIRASEAVQLFLARTRAARPGIGEDAASLAVAARICADLDGIPLALELAAARAKALSLADIADRIADRFRFLVSWRRLSASRHQTLREAMAWSFQLLADEEQLLMRRLSVFAGGFRMADAAEVCLDGDEDRTLAPLQRVVDASLVVVEEARGEARYRLLETVRQYAAEQLALAGEVDTVARRHAEHFAALATTERAWSAPAGT